MNEWFKPVIVAHFKFHVSHVFTDNSAGFNTKFLPAVSSQVLPLFGTSTMELTVGDDALLEGTILTSVFCFSELRERERRKKQYIGLTVVVTLRQIQSNDGFYPPTKDDVGLTCGQEKAPVCLCWTELKQQRQHIYCRASVAQQCLREGAATPLIYCAAFHSKQLTFPDWTASCDTRVLR